MTRGLFITFEGGDGVGKSTQISMLADHLRAQGHDVIMTREPGGTHAAEAVRNLILQSGHAWLPISECLLFFAARFDHWARLIDPALTRGAVVLCDRFTDSTRVYQQASGLSARTIEQIKIAVLGAVEPDLTLIFDLPVDQARLRAAGREAVKLDFFEQRGDEFHESVRRGFQDLAHDNPDRCVVIDASETPDRMARRVAAVVDHRVADRRVRA